MVTGTVHEEGFDDEVFQKLIAVRRVANDFGYTPTQRDVVKNTVYSRKDIEKAFGTISNARKLAGVNDWSKITIARWMADRLDLGTQNHTRSKYIHQNTGITSTTVGTLLKDNCGGTIDPRDGRPSVRVSMFNDEASSNSSILWRFEYAKDSD